MPKLAIQPGYQPIPGYVLKDKLGAGGYGEVWSASAPGGLTKAIKFVFGSIEDSRGSSELRSLNRMRELNHPFLLSIERVEVVESQLVIVTELAQGSLDDRFREYRQKGYLGIPRERLIRYLTDAAEGLDYLCQEHGLQHLDVKPGNLLLVADRVKVADFGLIKKLHSLTQSERNGLTPTYAAPEMFDGRPSPSSDQYSLAIAYIELLSGSLPFRGRTCAQLANEHLNKAPNLEAIPLIERPVVARALSKKPNLRFSNCREFVRALNESRVEAKSKPSRQKARIASIESGKEASLLSKQRLLSGDKANDAPTIHPQQLNPTQNGAKPLRLLPPFPPLDADTTPANEKVLYIGLGGSGGLAIQQLRTRYSQANPQQMPDGKMRALYVDTDADSIEQVISTYSLNPIPHQDTLAIRLKPSQYFRQSQSPDVQRVPRRWVFNIPRSLKTEGVRPLGLLAFLDNAKQFYGLISQSIDELYQDNDNDAKLKVILMASAHGGTGGAIVTEVGYLIRQIASSLDLPIEIQVMLLCGYGSKHSNAGLEIASAIACMQDIQETFDSRGLHTPLKSIPESPFFEQIPFDRVTLIHGGTLGQKSDWAHAVESMVDYAWSLNQTDLGQRLSDARAKNLKRLRNEQDGGSTWLEVLGFRELNSSAYANRNASASRGCLDALNIWSTIIKKFINEFQGDDAKANDALSADGQLSDGQLSDGQFSDGQLSGGQLSDGQLSDGQLSDGQLSDGQLSDGQFSDGQLSGGQLSGGQLSGGQLSGGQLSGGQLSGGQPIVEPIIEVPQNDSPRGNAEQPGDGLSNNAQANDAYPSIEKSGEANPSDDHSGQAPAGPKELSWTNELFRGQQLTISSWVRRVLATFTPVEKPASFASIELLSTEKAYELMATDPELTDLELEEIRLIAAQLNYDSEQARSSILNLLRVSKSQLWFWLEHSVLGTFSGWTHLGEVLRSIQRRFDSNVDRINEIVSKLEEKRNARLEALQSSDEVRPVGYDLMLETLTLETRLHSLAAGLQENLSRSIQEICRSWRQRSLQLHEEITATSNNMLAELGITNSGTITAAQISGLIWNPFFCEAARHYMDYTYSGFADCWNVESEARRKLPMQYKDLGELVRVVRETVSKPRRSEVTADFEFPSKSSSTTNEIAIFQDAFGWHAMYGNASATENSNDASNQVSALSTPLSIDFDFNDEFRRAIPQWMENGGEIRNVLVVSPRLESMFDSQHQQQIVDCRASLVRDPLCPCCSIYSIGERIDLQGVVQQAWPTNPSLQELVQRLRCPQSGHYQVEA